MELLPSITCPTLIIHGEKDAMVPSVHPQFLLQHVKDSRLICGDTPSKVVDLHGNDQLFASPFRLHLMPEGKHNLHLRYAAEFNTLVEDFLRD